MDAIFVKVDAIEFFILVLNVICMSFSTYVCIQVCANGFCFGIWPRDVLLILMVLGTVFVSSLKSQEYIYFESILIVRLVLKDRVKNVDCVAVPTGIFNLLTF